MVWYSMVFSDAVFFGVELCALWSGIIFRVWHCMVWFRVTLNGGATQLSTRPRSIGCENNGHTNRTMTVELHVMENH